MTYWQRCYRRPKVVMVSPKTRIMYGAYLSSNQLKEYIAYCQGHGLVSYDSGKRVYKTTNKGIRLLEIFEKMREIVPSGSIEEISA